MSLKSVLSGKKNLIYLGSFVVIVALIEVLIFNQGFLLGGLSGLEERKLSISEGSLNQFHLEGGKLIALNNDPNITFDNLNMGIDTIFIKCNNVVPGALGQVFYRNNKKDFNEFRSIQYDANLKTRTIHLPENQMIYSLRFDLTNVANDVVSCGEIVINPWSPFRTSKTRLVIYLGLLLLFILYIFRDIKPIKSIRQKTSPILKKMLDALSKVNTSLESKIEETALVFSNYFRNNLTLIFVLVLITVAAYGFELFNFNITIDEEILASQSLPIAALAEGRWGTALLIRFLLPYTVIPFVSLFLALTFHIGSILLLLKSWDVKSTMEQIVIGAVCITFPSLPYIYTFSTVAYAIGIGFFCAALSLFLYLRFNGPQKYLSIIPAAFAISIYQGFALTLVCIFLVFLISFGIRKGAGFFNHILHISVINMLSILAYIAIQKILFFVNNVTLSNYITDFFSLSKFRDDFGYLLLRFWDILSKVYLGDRSIYSYKIEAVGILIAVSFIGLAISLLRSKSIMLIKATVCVISPALILLPFIGGFVMNGNFAMRSLLGLPIVMSGLVMLGMGDNPKLFKFFVAFFALVCVFQFVRSDNHLFGSSYIALQADRSVGTRLIERIEEVKSEVEPSENKKLMYMEVVGFLAYSETELMPKLETFGASFFEWDQGSTGRVLAFLRTLGYEGLVPLPEAQRSTMIEVARTTPSWPEIGSVKVVGDTVLVKFGPYSDIQRVRICSALQKQAGVGFDVNSCVEKMFSR